MLYYDYIIVLQRKLSRRSRVDRIGKQITLEDGGKIVIAVPFIGIVLFDEFQCFTQLEHRGDLVFAATAAKARAGQSADLTIAVFKLDLIEFASFDDGIAFGTVNAEILDLVAVIKFIAACADFTAGTHAG